MSSSAAVRLFDPSAEVPTSPPPLHVAGVTVREVLEWFEGCQLGSSHAKVLRERRRLWTLFVAEFGDFRVADCKRYHLLGWLNKHASKLANHTRKRWNATIQVAFNTAAQLDFIPFNPFFGLKLPKGKKGRDWSDTECRAVLRHTHIAAFRRFIMAIRLSGMRPGEIAMMEWSHLHQEGDGWKVLFREAEHKTGHVTGEPRVIPVNRKFYRLLDWVRRHNPKGSKRVFLNSKGTPWKTRSWTKDMKASRERAGLSAEVKCHGGRHTFITQSQLAGVDVATVSQIVGHKSIATTVDGYTHLDGKVEHLADAMEQAVTPKQRKKKKAVGECPLFEGPAAG